MENILIIGLGGFIGAVLRYQVSGWAYQAMGTDFPYGTLVVNIAGSFVLGLFLTFAEGKFMVSPVMRSFIAIGILGAFTTFSTFSFETVQLMQSGSYISAVLNIVLSLALGIPAVMGGILIAKFI